MPVVGNITYDKLEVGDSASCSRTLTEEDITLFATVSGDFNPIHTDPEYADQTLFKERVAHGMWSGCLIASTVNNLLPGPGTVYIEQSLHFIKPVKIRDDLTITITVKEKLPKGRVLLDCKISNQKKEVVVEGVAKVIAPSESVIIEKSELPSISIDGKPVNPGKS